MPPSTISVLVCAISPFTTPRNNCKEMRVKQLLAIPTSSFYSAVNFRSTNIANPIAARSGWCYLHDYRCRRRCHGFEHALGVTVAHSQSI